MSTATTTRRISIMPAGFAPFLIMLAIVPVVLGLVFGFIDRAQYTEGFCAGAGGTVLSDTACNVGGNVATITGADTFLLQFTHPTEAYANGYCTAKGGTVLNTENCDVNGKVVTFTFPR